MQLSIIFNRFKFPDCTSATPLPCLHTGTMTKATSNAHTARSRATLNRRTSCLAVSCPSPTQVGLCVRARARTRACIETYRKKNDGKPQERTDEELERKTDKHKMKKADNKHTS